MEDKAKTVKKYRVRDWALTRFPDMVCLVPLDLSRSLAYNNDIVCVAIGPDNVEKEMPGNGQAPPTKRIIKAATQAQLKYLYEVEKNPFIELYED